jgi:hypothetical protein
MLRTLRTTTPASFDLDYNKVDSSLAAVMTSYVSAMGAVAGCMGTLANGVESGTACTPTAGQQYQVYQAAVYRQVHGGSDASCGCNVTDLSDCESLLGTSPVSPLPPQGVSEGVPENKQHKLQALCGAITPPAHSSSMPAAAAAAALRTAATMGATSAFTGFVQDAGGAPTNAAHGTLAVNHAALLDAGGPESYL